jgi:hypothetical protein
MNDSILYFPKCLNITNIFQSLFIFGFVSNGICITVFILIIKRTQSSQLNGNMFKYLLMKSIMDFCSCILEALQSFEVCPYYKSIACSLMITWVYDNFFRMIFLSLSIIFEVAATFDCYLNIKRILNYCQTNLFFYLFSILVTIFISLIHLVFPLSISYIEFNEVNELNNETIHYYYPKISKFGKRFLYTNKDFINSLMRDFILFIILVVLNVMILNLLIKVTKNRLTLVGNNNHNHLLTSSQKAERKKMVMIIATGLSYMIGHFPYFVYTLLVSYSDVGIFCYFQYINLLFHLSYVDGIFFYFSFNNIFKNIFMELIPFFKRNR